MSSVPHTQSSQSIQPDLSQVGNTILPSQETQLVLVCIHTKNSTGLTHIKVDNLTNDQYIFEQIHQECQRIRNEQEFRLPMVFPLWIRNFSHASLKCLERPFPKLSGFFSPLLPGIPGLRLFKSHQENLFEYVLKVPFMTASSDEVSQAITNLF